MCGINEEAQMPQKQHYKKEEKDRNFRNLWMIETGLVQIAFLGGFRGEKAQNHENLEFRSLDNYRK